MVVLSVALCTRTGRVLLSRQFVETTRMRVEGLLAAFPKLVADAGSAGKQHTFVETDSVRYVYMPLESMYLILITNKSSNIIEDLDTLRLLSKVIPDQLKGSPISEETITAAAFELLFAFDEVIAAGGYREEVTLDQVRTNLEMESHQETIAKLLEASRIAAAKDMSKKKAAMLREKAKEEEKLARSGLSSGGRMGGISGNSASYDTYSRSFTSPTGSSDEPAGGSYTSPSSAPAAAESTSRKPAPGGGLKLGGKKGAEGGKSGGMSSQLKDLMAEEGLRDVSLASSIAESNSTAATLAKATASAAAAVADQATILMEEKLSVVCTRDGTCESVEIKGMLSLTAQDESHATFRVLLGKTSQTGNFTFQTHPRINKTAFSSSNTIELSQVDKPFPVSTALPVLRWNRRLKDCDISDLPLSIVCWPDKGANGAMNVNLEYTLHDTSLTLHDVAIIVPLGGDTVPKVTSCSAGDWKHNTREQYIAWHIDEISEDNATATMEFTVKAKTEGAFFPVNVQFASQNLLCGLDVKDTVTIDDEKSLRYGVTKSMATESYIVQ